MKKKLIVVSLTSTLLASSMALTPNAFAENYDETIRENKDTIEESENQVHNLEETIQSIQVDVQNTEDELSSINDDISSNESRIKEAAERLDQEHKKMKELQEEIVQLEEMIEKRNEQLEKQARSIQVDGQTMNYIEFVMDAESLTDIIGRIDVVSSLVGSNRKLLKAQVRDKEAVSEKQEETEQTIVQQNALAAELETISEELEQQQLEKEVLVAQLASERATAEADRERFLAQKAEAEQAVVELVSARTEAAEAAQAAERRRMEEENGAEAEVPAISSQNETAADTASIAESDTSNESTENQVTATESKPETETPSEAQSAAGGVTWDQISSYADGVLGTPYLYGGSTTAAFDCSGFTSYVFRQVGVSLPRSAAAQYASAKKVADPRPGDLVFFSESGSRITHVGIYAGGGRFIGSQTSTGVAYTEVNSNYWGPRLVGYGRY